MRKELDQSAQIDRYLNNQLAGEEIADFEKRMKADPAFQMEVDSHRILHAIVVDQGLLELRKKLQAIDNAQHTNTTNFKRWGAGILLIAALSSVSYYVLTKDVKTASQSIPAKKVLPPEENVTEEIIDKKNENVKPPFKKAPATSNVTISGDTTMPSIPVVAERSVDIRTEIQATQRDTLERSGRPEQSTTASSPEKRIIDCKLQTSSIRITTIESCNGSPTGKMVIDENSDLKGKAPFVFSLDHKNYSNAHIFTSLYPGTYQLTIRDAAGCSWEYDEDIIIAEKDCRDVAYSFYPDNGEVWKIPAGQNSNGAIEIYSRNGSRVFSSTITNGYPDTWDGTSGGQSLPMGSYSFILKIEGKVSTGSVTILR